MIYSTLTEFIEESKGIDLSHRNLENYIYIKDSKSQEIIRCPYNHIIAKYRDLFSNSTVNIELTEEEQTRYAFNPRLMSYNLYGTVEFWSIILYLNDCGSSLEFQPTIVTLLLPDSARSIINEILMIQQND